MVKVMEQVVSILKFSLVLTASVSSADIDKTMDVLAGV